MTFTGVLQSARSNGHVVSDALSNDLILRTVSPGSRLLFAYTDDGQSVSSACFSSSNSRFNTPLDCELVRCEELSCQTVLADEAEVRQIVAVGIDGSNAYFQQLSASTLNVSDVHFPILSSSNASFVECTASAMTCSNMACASGAVDTARVGRLLGQTSNGLYLGATGLVVDAPEVSHPSLSSTTGTVHVAGTARGDRLVFNKVAASNICDPANSGDLVTLESNAVRVVASSFVTSNLRVQERAELPKGVSFGGFVVEPVATSALTFAMSNAGASVVMMADGNGVALRTTSNSSPMSLGVGISNSSVTIGADGSVSMLKKMVLPAGVKAQLGAFDIVDRNGSSLHFGRPDFQDDLATIRLNSAGRGGCLAFPGNLDAGARVVLWQDPTDVNVFAGLGKEPGQLVIRAPPTQAVSFVGGSGAMGSEHARITSGGALCIGRTTAEARLHVRALADEPVASFENTSSAATSPLIRCSRSTSAGNSVEFRVNGAVAGAISHPSVLSTFYGTTSDRRVKEVVGPLPTTEALDAVERLRPVRFTVRTDPEKHVHAGFLADEVQQVVPGAVHGRPGDPNRYQILDHGRLVPYLVAALQELQRQTSDLRAELARQTSTSDLDVRK